MKYCKDCKHFDNKGCITVFVPCREKAMRNTLQTAHDMLTTATSRPCAMFADKGEECGLF